MAPTASTAFTSSSASSRSPSSECAHSSECVPSANVCTISVPKNCTWPSVATHLYKSALKFTPASTDVVRRTTVCLPPKSSTWIYKRALSNGTDQSPSWSISAPLKRACIIAFTFARIALIFSVCITLYPCPLAKYTLPLRGALSLPKV